MVDGTGLENRHTRKGIGGSNPSLSARFFPFSNLRACDMTTNIKLQVGMNVDTPFKWLSLQMLQSAHVGKG